MTWVIGAAPLLGAYAAVVSDTRVTFGDGSSADLVRKVYPIGPFLVGGFAGSVQIGFDLLASIAEYLHIPPEESAGVAWQPEYVAEHWAPIAKAVFDSAPNVQKELGSQFLLAGPHPNEDLIPGRARPYVVRLSWPLFEPEIINAGALGIGSGDAVQTYSEGLRDLMSVGNAAWQGEVGNTGGWALALNIAVSTMLDDHPVEGIGRHVHIHVAMRGDFKIGTNDRTVFPKDGPPVEIKMPLVAQNWEQLVHMASDLGADVSRARA